MKRKIVRISLALAVVLSLCLSIGSPVIAADNGNKPVAWVNAAINGNKIKPEDYPQDTAFIRNEVAIKASIKLLADGTYVGNIVTHNFSANLSSFTINIDQDYTFIGELGGVKYAQIGVLLLQKPTDIEYRARFMFWDYGEPGKDDEYLMSVAWADFFDFLPDPSWAPWVGSMFLPDGGLPNGNVQIHLTDA